MKYGKLALLALSIGLGSVPSMAHAEWITSWAASPVPPTPAMGPIAATPRFENRTLRQILRVSAGGEAVRVRLTNAYGENPLQIGAARIVLVGPDGQEIAGTSRTLTFGGESSAIVPSGAPLLSDAVNLAVPALAKMAVTLYLPGETGPCTCHAVGLEPLKISAPGDFSAAPFTPESTSMMRAFLAGIEVDAPAGSVTLAIFGDSITDGVGSTPGADRRWPDILAERLNARGGRVWGVANQGISGNRVLHDGIGESALARFDRDVLALPGIRTVIVFEGVNDLGMAFGQQGDGRNPLAALPGGQVTADDVIDGYRQLIARAHASGVRVIGATIAPYKRASYWSPEGEAARQTINDWILHGGEFDRVLDFAAAFADPADPERMADSFHIGEHLHGNDAGYHAVAESIDLSMCD